MFLKGLRRNCAALSREQVNQILMKPSSVVPKKEERSPVVTEEPREVAQSQKKSIFMSKYQEIIEHQGNLEKYGVREIKYELPIPNIDPEFKGMLELWDELHPEENTSNMNLWELLKIPERASYDDFQTAVRNEFNFGNSTPLSFPEFQIKH